MTDHALTMPSKFERVTTQFGHGEIGSVDHRAKTIKKFAVITRGEALGHGFWIDHAMLQTVADQINIANEKGIKSRFTHPNISGDGLGKFLGRVRNAVVDGDTVRADLFVSKIAEKAPDGNLSEYVLNFADSDPDEFGASIVFDHDTLAENDFVRTNVVDGIGFTSPDPRNTENLLHARSAQMLAVDLVDDPAANPHGLFHRGDEIAFSATQIMDYLVGQSNDKPANLNGIDASRVKGFFSRYLTQNNLTITETNPMENTTPAPGSTPAPKTPTPAPETPVVSTHATPEATTTENNKAKDETGHGTKAAATETETTLRADTSGGTSGGASGGASVGGGEKFMATFGTKGAVWFAQGVSFDAARDLYLKELADENSELSAKINSLENKLSSLELGEADAAAFSSADGKTITHQTNALASKIGEGAACFAAGINLPQN